ncbi:hypothetical protein LTR37_015407 [Vermiconidia calcicola]|uniref:Uncharacterized protein n=1 Tax=Vermiconidia calcicola TaxID=1690605 RepID=A0ACC3MQU8_9PEZI|nr:hypothetical protein LTR37_015407 [Vermiconidia calcicola]
MDGTKEHTNAEFLDERKAGENDTSLSTDYEDPRIKAIKRKVDLRLSCILALMYCVNQIDRTNLGNAVVAGMDEALNLIGNRYTTIVVVFFPTYIAFNFVATVCARKLGPRPFLAAITLSFGLVVVGMGFAKSWTTLAALRVFLGIFESCFFPSAIMLVAMWYTRREVAKRLAFFYLIGNSVGGFGGVLAYGLQQMDGVQGHEGWRWIFIWEGIITIIIAIIGYIFLVDFPEDAHKSKFFLTSEEIELMNERIERDRGDSHVTKFDIWKYLAEAKDWKCWLFATNFGCAGLVTYSIAYFLPIILRDTLEFSVVMSQCLTAPCYVFSFAVGFIQSIISDKYNTRGAFLVFNALLQITGVAVLGFATPPYARYFGAYLITAGANSNVPISISYQSNNIVGQWKRAFVSANMVAMGGVGGIIGTLVFRSQDAPEYIPGLITCFLAAGTVIASVATTTTYMMIQNRKQAKGQIVIEGIQGFRYTL